MFTVFACLVCFALGVWADRSIPKIKAWFASKFNDRP